MVLHMYSSSASSGRGEEYTSNGAGRALLLHRGGRAYRQGTPEAHAKYALEPKWGVKHRDIRALRGHSVAEHREAQYRVGCCVL